MGQSEARQVVGHLVTKQWLDTLKGRARMSESMYLFGLVAIKEL